MRPTFLPLAAAAIALAVLATPTASWAGETESRSLFAEGRELRMANRCADAIPVFRRALETYPEGLGALRNVAECEEELGRFASARRSYWDLRLAAMQTGASKYEGWDKDAEAAHARLGAKVARVTVVFQGNRPEGLVVRFNGKPFDPRLVGVEIEQDNGPLEVSVQFGAGPPLTKTVQVVTSGRHVVEFDLGELPKPPVAQPTPPPATREDEGGLTPMQIGGVVALGVGGAALVGTVVSTVIRGSALSTIEDNCEEGADGYVCDDDYSSEKSTGDTTSLLVNVFAATAIVGAGVGVTLLIVGADDAGATIGRRAPGPRAEVGVTPLPGGGFLGIQGSM